MNVLYLHEHFATRSGAGGTRSYEFSQHLIRRGHTVTMVSQRRRGGGVDTAGRQKLDGIDLIVLGGWYTNHLSNARRMWQFFRFTIRACLLRNFPNRPDVVIATSTPLTIGIPGVILARRFSVPFVFEVRDLWPEAPIQLRVLRNPLLKWASRKLERWLYKKADAIIPLSPGMTEGVLAAGADESRISTIPNASDIDLFTPSDRDPELLRKYGVAEGQFVAVHAGSMGAANGLRYLIHAADDLQKRAEDGVTFMIVGAGGTEDQLAAMVRTLGLTNVVITGSIPRHKLGAVVASCDACVVSFADFPILATNSPNKLFDGLAAGLPIIVNSDGWTRKLVEENDAGIYVDVSRPRDLANAVVALRAQSELRTRYGANARALAENVFSRDRLATRFCDVLEHVARADEPGSLPQHLRASLISQADSEPAL